MAPQPPKASSQVLHTLNKSRPKRIVKRKIKMRRATTLSRTQTITRIIHQIQRQAIKSLHVFETATHPNPLIAECATISTRSYSWSKAKSADSALTKRINTTRSKPTPRRQYTTPGPTTRVWIPRWPNENPFLAYNSAIPEDRHGKSREAIVRIIQDQEEATKEFFTIAGTCRSWKRLPRVERRWQVGEHLSIALRMEGIEVLDWKAGCPGWKMEVYFQTAENWKWGWGLCE